MINPKDPRLSINVRSKDIKRSKDKIDDSKKVITKVN
jgi:hypothetical protein